MGPELRQGDKAFLRRSMVHEDAAILFPKVSMLERIVDQDVAGRQ